MRAHFRYLYLEYVITAGPIATARNKLLPAIAPMEDDLAIELCMRGYHVYSEATAGEGLLCEREPRNTPEGQ